MESLRSKEREEEDIRIQLFLNTPALQPLSNPNHGGVRTDRRGGSTGGWKSKVPPVGYVCRRCNVAGHFIQHCPTNGDPLYDIKVVKPPTGIPKSMLVADPDGFYVTPLGQACMQPNDSDFEKEIEGFPSKKPDFDLPPELHCPLCKEVMKDAVLTSKCCFRSFCDKCIRGRLIASRLQCVCGAKDMLADYLIPNMTLRRTINRLLESGSVSSSGSGSGNGSGTTRSSSFQVQDMSSVSSSSRPKISSLSLSCQEEHQPMKPLSPVGLDDRASGKNSKRSRTTESANVSEASSVLVDVEEPKRVQQESVKEGGDEEVVQQKQASGGEGKKKTRKRGNSKDVEAEGYMMNADSYAYNPYWNGLWTGMEGYYINPYAMDYGYGQFGIPSRELNNGWDAEY